MVLIQAHYPLDWVDLSIMSTLSIFFSLSSFPLDLFPCRCTHSMSQALPARHYIPSWAGYLPFHFSTCPVISPLDNALCPKLLPFYTLPISGEDGVQPQQQLTVAGGEANDWQMYYDEESTDEPIPWWFNSVTGESTWDCPEALISTAASSTSAAGVNEDEPKVQHTELAVVEPADNSRWTQLWSEEYQVLATRGF